MKTFISIYKSKKKEGMYLYLEKGAATSNLPDGLLSLFGEPLLVTHMAVDGNKKFAKVTAIDLLNSIKEKGFYLQIPKPLDEYKQYLVTKNTRLC